MYTYDMASDRTWTDRALAEAVRTCRSWRGVQRALDLRTTSVTRGLRRRADEMGLDYSHFTGQRPWGDMELRNAIASASSWRDAALRVGVSGRSGSVLKTLKKRARELGLDVTHLGHSGMPHPGKDHPFMNPPSFGKNSGLSVAAKWFLERGYIVSVPIEPTCYDLIVESDAGLKKIQVKTTANVMPNGRHAVKLVRMIYDAQARSDVIGRYRQVPYGEGMIDYFFIVTTGRQYLIPFDAVAGKQTIVLDHKYAAFAVA